MNRKKQKWLKHGDYAEASPCYKTSSSEFAQHLSPSIHTVSLTRGSNDRQFIQHQHITCPSGHFVLMASQLSSTALPLHGTDGETSHRALNSCVQDTYSKRKDWAGTHKPLETPSFLPLQETQSKSLTWWYWILLQKSHWSLQLFTS